MISSLDENYNVILFTGLIIVWICISVIIVILTGQEKVVISNGNGYNLVIAWTILMIMIVVLLIITFYVKLRFIPKWVTFLILFLIIAGLIVFYAYEITQIVGVFFNIPYEDSESIPHREKLWCHRMEENLPRYKAMKLIGGELDIHYDADMDDLVVGHDKPYPLFNKDGYLTGSGEPMLVKTFLELFYPEGSKIWFEPKNLTMNNYVIVIQKLREYIDLFDLEPSNFYVEIIPVKEPSDIKQIVTYIESLGMTAMIDITNAHKDLNTDESWLTNVIFTQPVLKEIWSIDRFQGHKKGTFWCSCPLFTNGALNNPDNVIVLTDTWLISDNVMSLS